MAGVAINYSWYDSVWLGHWAEARRLLSEQVPHRVEDFDRSLSIFQCDPDFRTPVLQKFLPEEERSGLQQVISAIELNEMDRQELLRFGRLVRRQHPRVRAIHHRCAEVVSNLCGRDVEPSYSFLSLYNNLGICEPHLDAPSANWTLDICIEQSAPWPISVSQPVSWPDPSSVSRETWKQDILDSPELRFSEHVMEAGDAIVFSGTNQWHYRNRIRQLEKQNFCHLLFLHFIPVGSRPWLDPNNWSGLLGIPELAELTPAFADASEHLWAPYPESANDPA